MKRFVRIQIDSLLVYSLCFVLFSVDSDNWRKNVRLCENP